MVDRRDVELLIRAKDLSTKPLRDVAKAIDGISDSLEQQVAAAQKGELSYQELAASLKQVQEAGKALAGAASGIQRFQALGDQSAKLADRVRATSVSLREFRDSLGASGAVTAKQQRELKSLEAAYAQAQKAFEKNQAAMATASASLEEAGVDTRNLVAAQQQIVTSATAAGQSATVLSTAMAGYARNAREAAAASRELKRENNFRKLADDADEAVKAAQRLATATGSAQPAQTGTSSSIRQLIDPAAQARSTLAGLEQQIEETGRAVAAITGPFKGYEQTLGQVAAAQRQILAVGGIVDRFRAQTAAVRAAREAYVQARQAVRDYETQIRTAAAPNAELERRLRQAQTALVGAAREFRAQANAARDTQVQLRQAGVDTVRLAAEQERLQRAAAQTTRVTDQLTAAFQRFGRSNRGDGFLGLSPYAIQNLGFQINDLFTQIAGGTSVTQAFAQQGGQILQVFGPGAFSSIARWIPMLAGFAAAAGVAAAALGRLYSTAGSDRNFAANLSLLAGGSGSGAGVTGSQLTRIARDVERLGFAFDDARKAALVFLRDGLAPANIAAATEAAARLSRVLGIDVAEAARLVSRALLEGRTGYLALQEAGVRFTVEQQRAMEVANASTDTYQRQADILGVLTQRFREADEQGLSPWQKAVIGARNAWTGLLDELGRTSVFETLKGAIDGSAAALQNLQNVGRIVGRGLIAAFAPVVTLFDRFHAIGGSVARMFGFAAPGAAPAAGGGGAPAAGSGGPTGREAVGGDTLAEQRAVAEATRRELELIRDDSRRTNRERIAAARRLAQIEVDEANAGASAQTRAYLAQLRLLEFRERLAKENERSGNAADARTRRDFQAIQQDIQNTIRVRDETVRGVQEDVAAGAISPAQAIERIQAAADAARPALQRLAEEARRFRDQQGGNDAVRRAAMDAQIATAERQAGALGSRTGTTQVLRQSAQDVNQALQERQNLVQTINALEQQGVISRAEGEERIRAGYEATNAALVAQIDAYEAAVQAAQRYGAMTAAAFQNATAQIELWRATLARVDPQIAQLKNSITQGVASAITTAFDSAAKAVGDFLAGVSDAKEMFNNLGQTALQFFADFLKAIAQAIIQVQALAAAKMIANIIAPGSGSVPVPHAGGVVGNGAGINRQRRVSGSWFANAPRMHSGGVAGLRPDEQAAILQRGEEVLTRDDPRNILNGGLRPQENAGGTGSSLRQVLAIGDQEIAAAMSGAAGEQVFLTWLRRNRMTIRQELG